MFWRLFSQSCGYRLCPSRPPFLQVIIARRVLQSLLNLRLGLEPLKCLNASSCLPLVLQHVLASLLAVDTVFVPLALPSSYHCTAGSSEFVKPTPWLGTSKMLERLELFAAGPSTCSGVFSHTAFVPLTLPFFELSLQGGFPQSSLDLRLGLEP